MREHDSKAVARSEVAILSALVCGQDRREDAGEDYSDAVAFFARRAAAAIQAGQRCFDLGDESGLTVKLTLIMRCAAAMADMPCGAPHAIAAKLHLSQMSIGNEYRLSTIGGELRDALQASALRDQMQVMGVAA